MHSFLSASLLFLCLACSFSHAGPNSPLQITALTRTNDQTSMTCWELTASEDWSSGLGDPMGLLDTQPNTHFVHLNSNISIGADNSWHAIHYPMLFVVLSGTSRIAQTDCEWRMSMDHIDLGGPTNKDNFMIVGDLPGHGIDHVYAHHDNVLALQIPLAKFPKHRVVHDYPCQSQGLSTEEVERMMAEAEKYEYEDMLVREALERGDMEYMGDSEEHSDEDIAREIWFTEQGLMQPFL